MSLKTHLIITLKHIILLISHIKSTIDLLLLSSFILRAPLHDSRELDKYSTRPGHAGPHDCAICLCSIEQGDGEARELNKCRHVFHGACIERWIACGHWTCPICRSHMRLSGRFCGVHEEIVVLGFVDSRMSDEENEAYNWWLR